MGSYFCRSTGSWGSARVRFSSLKSAVSCDVLESVFVIIVQVLCYYLEIPIGHDLFLGCHSYYSTLHQLYGFLLFWEWGETEFLGTAASGEPVVSSLDDESVLCICRMVIGRGKPKCS